MLDRVWGIRLPGSTAGHALEARIGPPPYTVHFSGAVDPDLPELFPRELVIVVSKEEIIVNDVKVADVIERSAGDGKGKTWEVPRAEGSFRIRALTAQLRQYRDYRSTLLRAAGLSPELADACDLATLIIDEELPFRFLSEIVLSAGHADVLRFRLATRSPDGLISYQVLSAPRLDSRLVDATHLLGDAWWREGPPQTRDFEFAYVNYIATSRPDDWRGERDHDLAVCVPPAVENWKDLSSRDVHGELTASLERIRADARRSASRAGATPPGDEEVSGRHLRSLEPGPGSDSMETTPTSDMGETVGDGAVAGDGSPPDAAGPVPAGTLVVAPEAPGARVPFIYIRLDGAYLVLYDMDRLEAVRSELFGPEKLDLMVETLKESHPDPGVLHLGADLDVPVSRLVEVADLLRYRCRIQSMSGRCNERERWLASVVLFASPPGRFGLMPEPHRTPTPAVAPLHPAMEEAGLVAARICPLKEIQEVTAPRLDALRACLADVHPGSDITLTLRWHAAGRLDTVATDPPLSEDRVRCIKAAMAPPAPTRDAGCDAALLIKPGPDTAG